MYWKLGSHGYGFLSCRGFGDGEHDADYCVRTTSLSMQVQPCMCVVKEIREFLPGADDKSYKKNLETL
jgi:hypothetical protein